MPDTEGVSDTEHPCSMATQVAHSEHPCSMPGGTVQEGLLELSRVLPPLVCLVICKPSARSYWSGSLPIIFPLEMPWSWWQPHHAP